MDSRLQLGKACLNLEPILGVGSRGRGLVQYMGLRRCRSKAGPKWQGSARRCCGGRQEGGRVRVAVCSAVYAEVLRRPAACRESLRTAYAGMENKRSGQHAV